MHPRYSLRLFLLISGSLFALLQQGESAQVCPYHDIFNELKVTRCTSGCCGDYHKAYCCINRHLGDIAAGSIGGFVLLLGLIILTVCCYRRVQQRRDNGSSSHKPEGVTIYGAVNTTRPSDRHQEVKDQTIRVNTAIRETNVSLTITPPTPT